MDSDLKYEFGKITDSINDLKRNGLDEIKRKIQDIDLSSIKDTLGEIKNRLEAIESKLQK